MNQQARTPPRSAERATLWTRGRANTAWLAAWAFFVAVMAAYSCVILLASWPPPFVDYPDWVYQGVLLHGAFTAHPVAGYALKHYAVPNSTTTFALGLLDGVLSWRWAAKLWVVLYLVLAGFASWAVLRALRVREARVVVALPALLFVNLDFWYGHIGFEIGVCLVLLLLAMLLRKAPWWAVAALLVVIFFTHMEACAGGLLLLGVWCAVTRRWRGLWAALPAVALTVWYGAARFSGGDTDVRGLPSAGYRYGSARFLVYKANAFLKIFGYVNAGTMGGRSESEQMLGRAIFVALIAASLVLAVLCLVKIVGAAVRPGPETSRRAIGWCVVVLLVISALLPQVFLGVADPGSRLLLLAAALALPMVQWRGRAGLAIACLSALFCLVNVGQLARVERGPGMRGHVRDLPAPLLRYGHVEPWTRLQYYDALQRGQMDKFIFPTGMFRQGNHPTANSSTPR